MATAAPDPKTFEAWDDAFQYPIPTVRAMEKKLRAGVTESQERVRGVVGSSYRDLLSTAHTIMDIHTQTLRVEDLLALAAKKSDSRVVEKTAGHAEQLHKHHRARDAPRFALAAQLAALKGALSAVADCLRTDADADKVNLMLGAAKLLLLARLLLKAASSHDGADAATVEKLGGRLAATRSKLLRQLDRRLSRVNIDSKILVADLSAFALVTSSPPTEVLKHLVALRQKVIESQATSAAVAAHKPAKRLQVFFATVRDIQAVFPALLAASLRSLSAGPLLQDTSVRSSQTLNLDVNERWFAPSVAAYTPQTRHDDLAPSTVTALRKDWFKSTLALLSRAISADLAQIQDLSQIVNLRRTTLQLHLSSRHTLRGLSSPSLLEALRKPFNDQIESHLLQRLTDLQTAVQQPVAALIAEPAPIPTPLWSPALTASDPSSQSFKTALIAAHKGYSAPVAAIISAFDAAAETIASAPALLKTMAEAKWDDDDDDDDDASDDDADNEPSFHQLLSVDDPKSLHTALARSTKSTLEQVESFFASTTADLPCTGPDAPLLGVLRILRELRARAPGLTAILADDTPDRPAKPSALAASRRAGADARASTSFCAGTVAKLHDTLVTQVAEQTRSVLPARLAKFYSAPSTAQGIVHVWDGGAPGVPTPGVTRYLKAVVREMERLGGDVWGGDAAARLRAVVDRQSASALEETLRMVDKAAKEPRGRNDDARDDVGDSDSAGKEDANTGIANADKTKADKDDTSKDEASKDKTDKDDQVADKDTADEADADDKTKPNPDTQPADKPTPTPTDNKPPADPATANTLPLQLLFDTTYLAHILSRPARPAPATHASMATLRARLATSTPTDTLERLDRNAASYATRTALLWGLLTS